MPTKLGNKPRGTDNDLWFGFDITRDDARAMIDELKGAKGGILRQLREALARELRYPSIPISPPEGWCEMCHTERKGRKEICYLDDCPHRSK